MAGSPLLARFEQVFGTAPAVTTEANGRVNLIGEHTDYNGGFVLPSAITQSTCVALRPRTDSVVRVVSTACGEASYRIGHEARTGTWIDYVQGMSRALADAGSLSGFDAAVASDVPIGSGLASSAALEVAFGRALREAFGLPVGDVEIARAGQRAEHELVGAPVGIMDQMAASLADTATALLLDTRSLEYERIRLPAAGELLVIHSGIVHDNARGEYAKRRDECRRAAALLGVAELRDVGPDEISSIQSLPAPLDRRARHVVTENARVIAAAAALRRSDLSELGELFNASHASLRDDFEVSIDAIDTIVAIATTSPDVFGARITGGGFGGSVVALTRAGVARSVGRSIAREYAARTPHRATIVMPSDDRREARG
jgi:galactokinase